VFFEILMKQRKQRNISNRKSYGNPRRLPRAACGIALVAATLCAGTWLHAQTQPQTQLSTVQGRVLNGTTGRPVANAEVSYVQMTQGPAPVAQATTDAEGRFRLQGPPAAGPAPILLRVDYQGATYSHPVLPGSPTDAVEIQVFDGSRDAALMAVKEQVIFLHPAGDTLTVLEQVIIQNASSPPRAYVNPQGTYLFTLPRAARSGVRVTVTGPGGMPIGQTPEPRGQENAFALTYPIRPGETQFRIEYALDYQSPFSFEKPIDVASEQTHVVTTGAEVKVEGEGLEALPADPASGFVGYRVTQPGTMIRVQVSGESQVREGAQSELAEEGGGSLVPIPPPIAGQRWLVFAAAGLLLLGGFVYLYTR